MSIVTLPTAAPPAQLSLFDYEQLPPEARDWARNTTSQIKQEITQLAGLVRQTAWSVWRLGRGLAEMQEKLTPLGQFSAWVEAEVPTLSRATAYNAIAAYKAFPSGLPSVDGETLEMPLKALYLLASPNAEPVREQVIERAITTGTPITTEAVKAAVAERGAGMGFPDVANLAWPASVQLAYGVIAEEWAKLCCAFAFAQPYQIQQARRLMERLRAISDRHEPDHLIEVNGVSRLGPASAAQYTIERWINGAEESIRERGRKAAAPAPKATAPVVEDWPAKLRARSASIESRWNMLCRPIDDAASYHLRQAKLLCEDLTEVAALSLAHGVKEYDSAPLLMTITEWIKALEAHLAPTPQPARLSQADRDTLDQIFLSFSLFSPTEPDAVTVIQRDQATHLLRDLSRLRDQAGEHPEIETLASTIQRWRMGYRDEPTAAPVTAAASAPVVVLETHAPEWRTAGERLLIECAEDVREAAFALEVASDLAIVLSAGVDRLIEGGKLHPALEAALVAALGGDAESSLGDVLAERLMEADGRANQFEAAAELLAAIVEVA
jgi:hypothetical protein